MFDVSWFTFCHISLYLFLVCRLWYWIGHLEG